MAFFLSLFLTFIYFYLSKITILKGQNESLNFSYQREISELQRKLECSSHVIKSLERESSKESRHISHLQEEILNMSKMMMEERVCEQRMLKARSMDEIERLRDLDRDKLNLERKLNDARTAMDGYSERLKNKVYNTLAERLLYLLDISCSCMHSQVKKILKVELEEFFFLF